MHAEPPFRLRALLHHIGSVPRVHGDNRPYEQFATRMYSFPHTKVIWHQGSKRTKSWVLARLMACAGLDAFALHAEGN